MRGKIPPFVALVTLAISLGGLCVPAQAQTSDGAPCPAGVEVLPHASGEYEHSGTLTVSPNVVERQLEAGQQSRACIRILNRKDNAATVRLFVMDAKASRSAEAAYEFVKDGQYGLASWLQLPAKSYVLAAGADLTVPYIIQVPANPSTGTSAGGIFVSLESSPPKGPGAGIVSQIVQKVFVTTPGNIVHRLRIIERIGPRIVTHGSYAHLGVVVHNKGNVTEDVSGRFEVKSSLGGRRMFRSETVAGPLLREGRRSFEAQWTGVPWVGRFQPTVEIESRGKVVQRVDLPPIWVIPPKKYLAALLAAILIPIALVLWRRRKNSWRQYLDDEDDLGDDELFA